jgi:hypothetical protein
MALSSTAVRAQRLRSLVEDERRTIKTMRVRIKLRNAAMDQLTKQLASDEELLGSRLTKYEARLAQLDEWKKEPVVIVRTSVGGYGRPVYHDAKEPCGFGANLLGPHSMLLAEAEDEGYRGCTSCGYRARRRRAPNKA